MSGRYVPRHRALFPVAEEELDPGVIRMLAKLEGEWLLPTAEEGKPA